MTEKKTGQLGLIFHWGLYSVPAFDVLNTRRRILNGSEWYYKRLTETGKFRPVSDYKATQEYHAKNYTSRDYYDFAHDFAGDGDTKRVNEKIEEWMMLAVKIGASYVILTTKHHDGYCLWPSKAAKHCSKVDLLTLFCTAARKYGLRVGLYYSWSEFGRNVTKEYVQSTVIPQMEELRTYKPDIWWFDGQWDYKSKYSQQVMGDICTHLKKDNPMIAINDRINEQDKMKADMTYLGAATYRVYADRYLPDEKSHLLVPGWEHINTIGLSWGRNKQQQAQHYKNSKELLALYKKVKEYKGNLLLNLGPDADGTLDPREVEALKDFKIN